MTTVPFSFHHPGLSNPREAAQPQQDGTFKRVLLVDCALDLHEPADPTSALSDAVDEALEVAAIHGFGDVVFYGGRTGQ